METINRMDRLGIIGGTGLYSLDGLQILEKIQVETPYGLPSSSLALGKAGNTEVVFLPRHGEHHTILPSEINFRANIWALKAMGCGQVISVSATGSLEESIAPGDLALVEQYFDWTKGLRPASFFGDGIVAHISTAHPACGVLSDGLDAAARRADVPVHRGKTYACVEGPRLGTRAESFFLRGAQCHLVGMTNLPEAFLAREAQLSYVTLAVATDYDCWKEDPEEHVTVDQVIARYGQSIEKVKRVLKEYFKNPADTSGSPARKALSGALLTPFDDLGPPQRVIWDFLAK